VDEALIETQATRHRLKKTKARQGHRVQQEHEASQELVEVQKMAEAQNMAEAAHEAQQGSFNNENTKCIMCLYLMEMIERDVGFPQRDFYSDVYPSYSSRNANGAPGPASYMRNFGGAVSQPPGSYNPIPGPGYSFLEQSERLSTTAKVGSKAEVRAQAPVGAWTNAGDYSTISTPEENLHARMVEEQAAERAHDLKAREPAPVPTDMYSMYENAFEANSGVRSAKSVQRPSAMRSAQALNSGEFLSLLQTDEGAAIGATNSLRGRAEQQTQVHNEGKFIGGAASAMGLTVCRDGKKYCRPRLKQPGRRQLERRVTMQAVKSEYAEMQGMMARSLADTCSDMPTSFSFNCPIFISKLGPIAQQYLHDYDDEEICSDLKMCTYQQIKAPLKPFVMKMPMP